MFNTLPCSIKFYVNARPEFLARNDFGCGRIFISGCSFHLHGALPICLSALFVPREDRTIGGVENCTAIGGEEDRNR